MSSKDMNAAIHMKLVQSGELERLKEHLRDRLIECGWKDQLKIYAKEVIYEKGLNKISHEELLKELTVKGRASVPDSVKRELLAKIKQFLAQEHI